MKLGSFVLRVCVVIRLYFAIKLPLRSPCFGSEIVSVDIAKSNVYQDGKAIITHDDNLRSIYRKLNNLWFTFVFPRTFMTKPVIS